MSNNLLPRSAEDKETEMAGVDGVVLSERDLEESGAMDWKSLPAVVFVWQGGGDESVPDDLRWLHLDPYPQITFKADGEHLQASTGK